MTIVLLCLLWLPSAIAQTPAVGFNRSASTARGLVAWWRAVPGFTGGRVWYDLLGHAPGTLTSMGTAGTTSGWATPTRPGSVAELRFDGTNDYVVTPVSPRLFPATVTYTLWVKRLATGGDYQTLLGTADGTSRSLYLRSTGMFATNALYTGSIGQVYQEWNGGPALALGTWYHVAWSHLSGTGMTLWVNCQVYATFTVNVETLVPVTSTLTLGADAAGTANYATVALDDGRVYNRALTQSELCQAMRDAVLGEPALLPPSPLLALLGSVPTAGTPGSFLPFINPQ